MISVGNIAVGGTGKTPVVQWLVFAAEKESGGCRPRLQAGADGQNDEAAMLSAPVFCDPTVFAAAGAALRVHDILIMDDGFQHRCLHRDVDWSVLMPVGRLVMPRLLSLGPCCLVFFARATASSRRGGTTRCEQADPAALAWLQRRVTAAGRWWWTRRLYSSGRDRP